MSSKAVSIEEVKEALKNEIDKALKEAMDNTICKTEGETIETFEQAAKYATIGGREVQLIGVATLPATYRERWERGETEFRIMGTTIRLPKKGSTVTVRKCYLTDVALRKLKLLRELKNILKEL